MHEVKVASQDSLSSPREGSSFDFSGIRGPVKISNCHVTKEGFILDEGGNPIHYLHDEHIYWQGGAFPFSNSKEKDTRIAEARKNELFSNKRFNPNLSSNFLYDLDTPFVYIMHPFGWYAYGHLFDSLQRLYLLQTGVIGIRHLLVSDSRRVVDFDFHVAALGYSSRQVFHFPYKLESLRIRNLLFSYSPATLTQFTDDSVQWIRNSYLNSVDARNLLARHLVNRDFCLLLDRSKVLRRSLLNQDEIISRIEQAGIRVIRIDGTETLAETIFLFSTAKYIVGAHGAMFVNTIFADNEATIVELCPNNRRRTMMLSMCKPCRNHTLSFWQADNNHNISPDPSTVLELMHYFDNI
jgi:hypothetical protein